MTKTPASLSITSAPSTPQPCLQPIPSVKLLRRIPNASREEAGQRLAGILNEVVRSNYVAVWDRLFHFNVRCLRVPVREAHQRSLATAVNEQLSAESDPLPPKPRSRNCCVTQKDPLKSLARRVSFKLEKGDFNHLASSEDK